LFAAGDHRHGEHRLCSIIIIDDRRRKNSSGAFLSLPSDGVNAEPRKKSVAMTQQWISSTIEGIDPFHYGLCP
jgi:hypothetical protein